MVAVLCCVVDRGIDEGNYRRRGREGIRSSLMCDVAFDVNGSAVDHHGTWHVSIDPSHCHFSVIDERIEFVEVIFIDKTRTFIPNYA